MVSAIFLLGLNFIIFLGAGITINKLFNLTDSDSSSLTTLTGIISLNLFLRLIHFFYPLGRGATWAVILVILASIILNRHLLISYVKRMSTSPLGNKLLVGLVVIFCSLNIASRPCAFDTGTYHLQAIQWNEAYAIVPGLANLIRQLGFNSNWYILQAFSGFSFAGFESVYPLNSLLLLLFIGYLIPNHTEPPVFKAYKLISLLSCLLLATGKYVGEVTADLPVMLLLSWTFLLVLETETKQKVTETSRDLLIFILPVYLITIKISAAPVLLVSLYFWIKQTTATKIKYMALAALFVVTWLIGNIILTGYLIFPFGGINLFTVDWKVPDLLIRDENYSITGWGRGPYHPVDVMANMRFIEWFPIWLKEQKLYNWVFIGALLTLTVSTRKKIMRLLHQKTTVRLLLATVACGIIFWFVNVPDFRFVYGYLIPALCAAGSLFLIQYKKISDLKLSIVQNGLLVFTCLAGFALIIIRWPHCTSTIWLSPAPYPVNKVQQITLPTGHQINVATWEQKCWNMPLPCTCEYYKELELRKNTLQQGFRIKHTPDQRPH